MRKEVEPALLKISRTLAEGGASPAQMVSSFSNLKEAIASLNEQRDQMREKVVLLLAHEEIVNTPEFGGFLGTTPGTLDLSSDDSQDESQEQDNDSEG